LTYTHLGEIALTQFAPIPYNMNMKNTKAIFLIVLGSFVIATGYAFAEEKAIETLLGGRFFGQVIDTDTSVVTPGPNARPAGNAPTTVAATPTAPIAQAVPAVPAPKPTPAPTAGEQAKKFVKKYMGAMVMTGVGAYLGMALMGPAGIVTGAVLMFALVFLGSL